MSVTHRCWAEVDLHALRQNLAWIRHRVGMDVKIMTVVKADAYGHGLKQIAALLMQSGTDIFGVANLAEAHSIRSVGKGWPILMLGACLPGEVDEAVRQEVQPTISSLAEAEAFNRAAIQAGRRTAVHVKVDTGMGRLGAPPPEALGIVTKISSMPGLELAGLYTHFASIEDDADYSSLQAERFRSVLEQVRNSKILVPIIHANNSGAVLLSPETNFNLIRPGLLVYGIVPEGRRNLPDGLRNHFLPALALKTRVSFVKDVPIGIPLSYGGVFITDRAMRVATLTAGYGDGYPRAASRHGEVLIKGCRCRLVGNITMDQMLADVSLLGTVQPGDEAVLIGRQGGEEIPASQVARWSGTIPWEVLTSITYRVQRIYRGGAAS